MICYSPRSGNKLNTVYFTIIISVLYFVTSSVRRNWQPIEVYLGEVIPKYVFLEENSSVTLYCNYNALAGHVGACLVPNGHIRGLKQLALINLKLEDIGRYFCGWTSGGSNFDQPL